MNLELGKTVALGVLGGMGPLASAEFLQTIYHCSISVREQQSPTVFLCSDPSVPDRTEALLNGSDEKLLEGLISSLRKLHAMGAARTVICCVTIHSLLPRLPADLRERLISLLDVICAAVEQSRQQHLLVCTTGTRKLRLFEDHPRWTDIKDYIVLPEESDQLELHEMIYRVKRCSDTPSFVPFLESLLRKYRTQSFIAGCTEMHVLARRFLLSENGGSDYGCIDPLTIIARELAGERK